LQKFKQIEGEKMAIDLNANRHESKVRKLDREQAKKNLQQQQKEIKPSDSLYRHQKFIFKKLIEMIDLNATPLSSIDSIDLSQLALELDILAQATKKINDDGIIIKNKRNPAIMVRNTSLKNVSQLLNDLNLTYNHRITAVMNSIENNDSNVDPLIDFLSDDENE